MLWEARRDLVELSGLSEVGGPWLELRVCKRTISTLVIAEVISSQHPQFMGNRCTLRKNHDNASSVFFSFAKTMP